jgi:nucleotide-binding universal stress UspA family protein
MPEPRKILVATDFSASADRALDTAIAIAARTRAEVHLLHALEVMPPPAAPYAVAIPDDLIGAAREAALRKLRAAEARVSARGLTGTGVIGTVPAAHSIATRAQELGADLVVVGSRGHTGLKRFLLGSVAEHTVRTSPVSVLTVRGEGHAEAPSRIVAAVDFSEHAERAVAVAADWARAFGAQLHLVNGLQLAIPFVAPYEVTVPDSYIDAAYADATKRLGTLAASISGLDVHTTVLSAAAHEAIDTLAARVKADLIVTGSRGLSGLKHALLGSVAERTLRHAPCSVLIVKAPIGAS